MKHNDLEIIEDAIRKINFFKNSMESLTLVGIIEEELAKNFRLQISAHKDVSDQGYSWDYYIGCSIAFPSVARPQHTSRLETLLSNLELLRAKALGKLI